MSASTRLQFTKTGMSSICCSRCRQAVEEVEVVGEQVGAALAQAVSVREGGGPLRRAVGKRGAVAQLRLN